MFGFELEVITARGLPAALANWRVMAKKSISKAASKHSGRVTAR